ncbi:hypothetical protein Srot_2437 [Segniliparus rotundus DSM 44985]|uniref:Uncharacterized protein n=1 Tax=Segniliparus rotundus (strain ATCC BAA-972 / CDC 1076 / CIP 108378 / DSM 44985 / JCM 13578) TaxID=640132 RepID=D6ZBC9_SEGRD|nr:hypothetical protein Srot_2437 [Segniliparus rotundus DSM 44985]
MLAKPKPCFAAAPVVAAGVGRRALGDVSRRARSSAQTLREARPVLLAPQENSEVLL